MNSTSEATCASQSIQLSRKSNFQYAVYSIIGFSLLLRLLCIGSSNLLVEEAYYWNYAMHLDFGYLDHPPMVAVLIKLFTSLLGTNEFAVRIPSIFCWLLTAFFSFKLTNLVSRGAGQYVLLLLAILPFFFLHSLVITPDQPLIVGWSASLYCLYRALVLNESKFWYAAGIWLGLGMLSKYTIALLGPATFLYLCLVPTARQWFARKEPYICLLIVMLLFAPVIYWNATHDWVSFAFQSTRRLNAPRTFSFHLLLSLLVFFLTPLGIVGLWGLFKKNSTEVSGLDVKTIRFFQLFTIVPLCIFGLFSLTHAIKFNWIGPSLLATIPWLALLIQKPPRDYPLKVRAGWLITPAILLLCYSFGIFCISSGSPEAAYNKLFKKFIVWSDLAQQFNTVATQIETETNVTPIIVPLDLYNIASELSFYQAKLLADGEIQKKYPIVGCHIFGGESLMYRYWSRTDNLANKPLILIATEKGSLESPELRNQVIEQSPIKVIWSKSPGRSLALRPYYYEIVRLKSA